MNSRLPRSLLLELPREVRDLIYEYAIMSCTNVEDVKDHTVTDRPVFSTVTHNVHLNSTPDEESAQDRLHRLASPGGILLANRQLNAEFAEEMTHHCKLVGAYRPFWAPDGAHGFNCHFGALVHPFLRYPPFRNPLSLHQLRHYELQFDALTCLSARVDHRAADPAVWTQYIADVLGWLPNVTHVTLRLTIDSYSEYVRRLQDPNIPTISVQGFMSVGLRIPRSLRVFKKVVTLGFSGLISITGEASNVRQVFPLYEQVEANNDATGNFTVVSCVVRDPGYWYFHTISLIHGYYWVLCQYFGLRSNETGPLLGTYEKTLDCALAGYEKWVANGKPRWNHTQEHREVARHLSRAFLATHRNVAGQVGRRLGYH